MSNRGRAAWTLVAALVATSCMQRRPTPVVQPPPQVPQDEPVEQLEPRDPFLLGVILPLTGDEVLAGYAQLVREGIDLAVAGADTLLERGFDMVVLDDGGLPSRAAQHIRDLDQRGASAVIGPLLAEALDTAAAARPDPSLSLISPTAPDVPLTPNVYTLNAGDSGGPAALAEYAARNGLGPVGLLFPAEPEPRLQAQSFRAAAQRTGLAIASDIEYPSGTTTFAQPLEAMLDAGIQSIFVAASARDVRQLAPQLSYYGLSDVQVLGTDVWAAEQVLGSLPAATLEGVIAAVPMFEASPEVAWQEFVARYEATQRRALDNPYPALGYDAASLVLQAAATSGGDRSGVASSLAALERFRGATGILSLAGGSALRIPFLVRIENGRPVLLSDEQPADQ